MEQLKSKFEKDLKTKLLFKTSGHMTEEILLLKNFKYFDEDNTNKCDSETFFQVISKVGVLSLSEDELNQLFNYYSKGQELLNYKDFIGEVFNNESLKNKKEAPPQKEAKENEEQNENEEELDHIDELILKIRNTLSQKGLSNLIKLEETVESQMNGINKQNKNMKVLVHTIEDETPDSDIIIKSKDIICPICRESCRIKVENYKIKLFGCINQHTTNNIKIKDFPNTQKINISKLM